MGGCSDDDDDPVTPSTPVDVSGTYSFQGVLTPISGDCSGVIPTNSGTATFAQDSSGSVTITTCEFEMGQCNSEVFSGTAEGEQVTMRADVALSEEELLQLLSEEELAQLFPDGEVDPIEVHVNVTGPVTDTSSFTLSGDGTKEPGACVLDASVTLTKM